jgi:hypothetical protein
MEIKSIANDSDNETVVTVEKEKRPNKKVFRGVLLDIDTGKYLRIYRLDGTDEFILE